MVRKRKAILDVYQDKKTSFLEPSTILNALKKRGFKMSKRGLSNFIRNNLEHRDLIPSRDDKSGIILGWTLVRSI